MKEVLTQLSEDFRANDYTACRGVLDYLVNEMGYTSDRLIKFLKNVYNITDVEAIEVLEVLSISFVIN